MAEEEDGHKEGCQEDSDDDANSDVCGLVGGSALAKGCGSVVGRGGEPAKKVGCGWEGSGNGLGVCGNWVGV